MSHRRSRDSLSRPALALLLFAALSVQCTSDVDHPSAPEAVAGSADEGGELPSVGAPGGETPGAPSNGGSANLGTGGSTSANPGTAGFGSGGELFGTGGNTSFGIGGSQLAAGGNILLAQGGSASFGLGGVSGGFSL